jgi:hypothetical protein
MSRYNEYRETPPLGTPRPPPPVTLPAINFPAADNDDAERKEAARRIAEQRVVRAARDAWQTANKAGSLEAIKTVGAALLIGRAYAMRVNGHSQGPRLFAHTAPVDEGQRIRDHVRHDQKTHHYSDGERDCRCRLEEWVARARA